MAKETGLICTGESVRAFLENRKSQTRRTRGLEAINDQPEIWRFLERIDDEYHFGHGDPNSDAWGEGFVKCPYGQVGDRVWVKETIRYSLEHDNFYYSADSQGVGKRIYNLIEKKKTISSRFMKKIYARIWREITGIRIERIQQMCHTDWVADFCPKPYEIEKALQTSVGDNNMKKMAKEFWDSINAKRGYGWDKNPWNWVLEVKEISDG